MAAACATLLAIALLCPGIASARRAPLVIPGSGIYAELGLKRSNGTSLVVFAHGTLVSVRLIKGAGIQAAGSEYSTKGRFTGDAVHADFGKLGLVSVTFKPTGRLQRSPQEGICKGKPRVTRRGFFTGTIRFRSDDGAIDFAAGRAPGIVARSPKVVCHGGFGGQGSSPPGVDEVMLSVADCHGTSLIVSEPAEPARTPFADDLGATVLVSTREHRGRLRIRRFVFALPRRSPLAYAGDLSSATLTLPPPFSGTAEFKRDPTTGEGTWAGSLKVAYPGKEVALTGPSLEAKLKLVKSSTGALVVVQKCPRK